MDKTNLESVENTHNLANQMLANDKYCEDLWENEHSPINVFPEHYRLFFNVMKQRTHQDNYFYLYRQMVRSQWLMAGFIEGLAMKMTKHPSLTLVERPSLDFAIAMGKWRKYTALWGVEHIPLTRTICTNPNTYIVMSEFRHLSNGSGNMGHFGDFVITPTPTDNNNEFKLELFGHNALHTPSGKQYPWSIVN